jgi:hypothetical protein
MVLDLLCVVYDTETTQDDGITVREDCSVIQVSLATWFSGCAYTSGGKEKVVKVNLTARVGGSFTCTRNVIKGS